MSFADILLTIKKDNNYYAKSRYYPQVIGFCPEHQCYVWCWEYNGNIVTDEHDYDGIMKVVLRPDYFTQNWILVHRENLSC